MSPERTALEALDASPSNKRPKERPKRYEKTEDFAILKVKNWRSIAGRRAEFKEMAGFSNVQFWLKL
ncbi:hypothetical protein TNCT_124581 [Trichonephila clavata]|uniref:Uncharacterized protein n=1 Tax=Trichonephila clavata TaxID=2740835 RepID=A0A8X6GX64_TRICU|nr:hypothetical protein TNCT_124581 [Trichonephila clavata]